MSRLVWLILMQNMSQTMTANSRSTFIWEISQGDKNKKTEIVEISAAYTM